MFDKVSPRFSLEVALGALTSLGNRLERYKKKKVVLVHAYEMLLISLKCETKGGSTTLVARKNIYISMHKNKKEIERLSLMKTYFGMHL